MVDLVTKNAVMHFQVDFCKEYFVRMTKVFVYDFLGVFIVVEDSLCSS